MPFGEELTNCPTLQHDRKNNDENADNRARKWDKVNAQPAHVLLPRLRRTEFFDLDEDGRKLARAQPTPLAGGVVPHRIND